MRGLLTLLVLAFAGLAALALTWARASTDTTGRVAFDRPLNVPPLAPSRVEDGTRVFELRATAGTTDFGVGDSATRTWGFNGAYLGPTLRAERGEPVRIDVTNALPEATTVHWHGHELPAAMDGGPHQAIAPGAGWQPSWTVDQPAATTWYHPHPHGATAHQVSRGMAGMFILDDTTSRALELPDEYGVDDIPVIVQDQAFDDDGQFRRAEHPFSPVGHLGDQILANGTIGGYHEVTTERLRLRLLNASPARVYDFGLGDDREFALVGTDGGLLPAPHRTDAVRLSPGERAEIVVSLDPGERVVLRSTPPDLGTDPWTGRFAGGDDRFDILQLRAAEHLVPVPEVPDRLAGTPGLDPADAVATRRFRFSGISINDRRMVMDRVDEAVVADTTELWELSTSDGSPHNFHVHGARFTVLEVDGERPGPELTGWKDTVYLAPSTTTRVLVHFADHADPNLPFMIHCHFLRHEDQGMMLQFVILEPGQERGRPPATHATEHAGHVTPGGWISLAGPSPARRT
ncbi:multicopper oxidase family protein [Actinomycetospora cinnamomea]|uniref:FtsP/CotA-like multicopper oxidase with cupredoxin domain n=1 Tax=Actinomycetospora cinnamomea TaxID=663609 RepID=A0A2U1FQ32_9PSEU|nr:multicopper oxidase domain-containing protein [Actinomycetospora cinnamomea]PVZ14287.1 FtsP/CotA-like multicopper oxidase with cupredoxin domain [Actinomycetospora cinnamomea]